MRQYWSCLHHKTGKTTSYKCAAHLGIPSLHLLFLSQGASTGAKLSVTKQLFSSFIESYLFYCLVISTYKGISMLGNCPVGHCQKLMSFHLSVFDC